MAMEIPAQSGPISLGLNLPYVEGSMDGATPRWADILAMAEDGRGRSASTRSGSPTTSGSAIPDGEWSGAWESWTLLTALAVATTRVRLGTYVLGRSRSGTRRCSRRWPRRSTRSPAGG